MHAASAPPGDRCNVSKDEVFQPWLQERGIDDVEAEPPEGRLGWTEGARQPYSIDQMNDFDPFINTVYEYCEAQGIRVDGLTQESGPAQFEINFLHGNAIELADQVFLFKRTVREAAIEHEMHATFLAKPMAEEAGMGFAGKWSRPV